jgi:hypothetical protein
MVYNVVEGGAVDDKLFNIPYANIRGGMTGNR